MQGHAHQIEFELIISRMYTYIHICMSSTRLQILSESLDTCCSLRLPPIGCSHPFVQQSVQKTIVATVLTCYQKRMWCMPGASL